MTSQECREQSRKLSQLISPAKPENAIALSHACAAWELAALAAESVHILRESMVPMLQFMERNEAAIAEFLRK